MHSLGCWHSAPCLKKPRPPKATADQSQSKTPRHRFRSSGVLFGEMGNSNVRPRTLSIDNDLNVPSASPAAPPQQAAVPESKPEGSFDPEGDPAAQLEAALAPLKRRLSRDALSAPPPQLSELAECLRSRKGGLCCLQPTQSFVEMANALPAAT